MDTVTKLYGVFGKPVMHSKSPIIHNACFKAHQLNSVYLAFEIHDIKKGIDAVRTLNIQGVSVTIPHKETIMAHIDWVDEDALAIGAVNTIVNQDGCLKGYNTDCQAAIAPLAKFGLSDKNVAIIGAGGAAQAVAFGIKKKGGRLTIVNRNEKKGKTLANKFQAEFISLKELFDQTSLPADIIINTTSVGMTPDIDATPIPAGLIEPEMIVMDIVYTPLKTKLLTTAEQKGCNTIDGLSMFLHQGAAQFRLWTGILPDIKLMRQAIRNGEE